MGYFAKHWRGKQSLAISYWVNAVLISVVIHSLCSALTAIAPIADTIALSRVALFVGAVTLFVIVPWNGWACGGLLKITWQTPARYSGRTWQEPS